MGRILVYDCAGDRKSSEYFSMFYFGFHAAIYERYYPGFSASEFCDIYQCIVFIMHIHIKGIN